MFSTKITYSELLSAYLDCRKHKRRTINASLFEMNYVTNLCDLLDEINEGRYEIGRSLAFLVTRPKLREVFAADFRDRVVHHLVIRKLEPLFEKEFIENSFNCRIGRGCSFGINALQNDLKNAPSDYYIGKFDIEGFFMHIDKRILWDELQKFINEKYTANDKEIVLYLTEKIVFNCPEKNCIIKGSKELWSKIPDNKSLFKNGENYGLPIGNLSSQFFANFYLNKFDHKYSKRFSYGRYVDDFYIVGKKRDILKAIPEMRRDLLEINLKLHPKKVCLQNINKGAEFIGSVVRKDRKYVTNRNVFNLTKLINKFNKTNPNEHTLFKFRSSMNSELGFLSQFESFNIRKRCCSFISNEWYRHFYINNGYRKVVPHKRTNEILSGARALKLS